VALNIDRDTSQARRPIGVGIAGAVLMVIAVGIYFTGVQDRSPAVAIPTSYGYTINQNVDSGVKYKSSSFYEDQDPGSNTAYITQLTDAIKAQFDYKFTGSKTRSIKYTYSVNAVVHALYALDGDSTQQSTVWTKEFQLVEPTTKQVTATSFEIDPTVEIPFTEYKNLIDQLNTAMELSLTSEVIITSTVRVSDNETGSSGHFEDTRVSTVSAPLNAQLYSLAVKFDKEGTGQVAATSGASWTFSEHYLEVIAGAIAVVATVMLVYGFRSQIFKTPYQRELDKIYRFHDGIIIRARRPANLKDKNVVNVQSFDDLLNMEEELKVPIVASPAGAEATHFIIVHDDVLYVYTLGKVLLEEEAIDEVGESMEEEIEAPKPPRRKHKKVQ